MLVLRWSKEGVGQAMRNHNGFANFNSEHMRVLMQAICDLSGFKWSQLDT